MKISNKIRYKAYYKKVDNIMTHLESIPEDDWVNEEQSDAIHYFSLAQQLMPASKKEKEKMLKLFNRVKRIFIREEDEIAAIKEAAEAKKKREEEAAKVGESTEETAENATNSV